MVKITTLSFMGFQGECQSNFQKWPTSFVYVFLSIIMSLRNAGFRLPSFCLVFSLKLHYTWPVRVLSSWLLCLFWHNLFLLKYLPVYRHKMTQIHLPHFLPQTWNQPLLQKAWFFLMWNGSERLHLRDSILLSLVIISKILH